jgi:hypothetical protein
VLLTVALDPADEAASSLHRTVLASLPARFLVTAGSGADVMLISGDQPRWRQRALAGTGARAIMLTGTRALTAAAVRDLAKETGLPVTGCPVYAAGPAWSAAVPQLAADLAESAVLDSVSAAPGLRAALVDQLAVIRPLLGELAGLRAAHVGHGCYILAGVLQGVAVTLAGAVSGVSRLDLDLVGAARRWHATLAPDALAFPARVSASDADGEHVLAPVYESPRRAAWAALHDAICQGGPLPYAADQLAADIAVAEAALGAGLQ